MTTKAAAILVWERWQASGGTSRLALQRMIEAALDSFTGRRSRPSVRMYRTKGKP